MKKMMTILSLFAVLSGWAQTKEERSVNDLTGRWRNSKGNGLDIMDSNTVYIVHGDQRKLASATVSGLRKSTANFDLTVKDSARAVTLKGLLMMLNDDTLQWQIFDSETKPVSYSYRKSDMLFMKRISNLIN